MTLQQLKYIVAVNRFRNFARAADACSVTQPTLSAMLLKLEDELGVRIFDRTSKTVVPTTAGKKIVRLAERTLADVERIQCLVDEEKGRVAGELKLSVGPTIAPYILPDFIGEYTRMFPLVQLIVKDMKLSSMLNALLDGSIDAGIGIAGNMRKGIKEIPLYTEPVLFYASSKDTASEFMWVMKEALSLRESAYSYYREENNGRHIYEATSVDELVRMVDAHGGFTVIPSMHMRYLTPEQRRNIVTMSDEDLHERKVSLYVKSDDVREHLLTSITTILRQVIHPSMQSPTLK